VKGLNLLEFTPCASLDAGMNARPVVSFESSSVARHGHRGWTGFDGGCKAAWGMPRRRSS